MKLRASDYEIRDVSPADARAFIVAHHYSGGCSNTRVYAHGLFRRGEPEILGVAIWLPPTKVAAQSVNAAQWRRVLSLTRLAVHSDVPSNAASYLMSRSIRLIQQDGRFVSLVTYADEFMGHTGAIYRASNWDYVGFMKGSDRWEDSDGRQVAKKSTVSRTNAEMEALGLRRVGKFRKHKFVMHLRQPRRALNDNALLLCALVA